MSKTVQYRIISTTKMDSAGPTCTGYTHSRPLGGVVRNKVTGYIMQTDATTPTMLGVAMHRGKDTTHKTCSLQGDHG